MTDLSIERPARRFLHICYCCPDADEVTAFFVDGLQMKNTMRTPAQHSSGAILGLDREIHSMASFVYDQRGPRVSPAIEIQAWYDPAPVGQASTDAFEIGIKALGFAVPSLDRAVARLTAMGCQVIADSTSPFDARQVTLLDPQHTMLELVENTTLDDGATQMHHLRLTVGDLDDSLPFYEMIGFDLLERGPMSEASFGSSDSADGAFARLRLPDEPFELRLVQWYSPASHGRHYTTPNHAGLFRAAIGVDDTRASYDCLTAAGAVFDRPPVEVELSGTPVPDMWITFISDPNGIPYEFVQRPRSAFR